MQKVRKRTPTETQSFGVSKREGHDSSKFYKRKIHNNSTNNDSNEKIENAITQDNLNKIFCKSSETMEEIPDSSIHLMITSPPYNVGKDYDQDLTIKQYRKLLKNVFSETYRVLVNGGRVCINIANIGRKPYIPLHSYIIKDMIDIGFLMRGEIIWNKNASAGTSTAWGSWKSAANPTLRDIHEYILIFSKGSFARIPNEKENTISKEEFLTFTKSVWDFHANSATKAGHPAPFPLELPYRCIQLYSFKNDIILDPFCGVGTTGLAAIKTKRYFIGYDNNEEYVKKARVRMLEYLSQTDITQF